MARSVKHLSFEGTRQSYCGITPRITEMTRSPFQMTCPDCAGAIDKLIAAETKRKKGLT